MNKPTIGIGILSWKAHQTLRQSLEGYKDNGFLEMFDEKIIYFSDMSDEDIAIAKQYGWGYAGGANEGIAGGMKRLGEHMKSDYIILLQSDNPICESQKFTIDHIQSALKLLENQTADIVRLRHRWNIGEGFADVSKYLKYFSVQKISNDFLPHEHGVTEKQYLDTLVKKLKRFFRPLKARHLRGRSVFIEENPDQIHPDVITKEDAFFIIDSSAMNFTDQCLMLSRETWLNVFCDYVDRHPDSGRSSGGFPAPETSINGSWWRRSGFKVAQGRGVFSHDRHDGSFRSEHHTNKNNSK
ncbi:MAG: hypothetical protein COB76_02970 [Alphaproteobacteria bacterium]|nr:MAG: hypothetical protein COB76_02970 [Alphaproteobacteria bacterium]